MKGMEEIGLWAEYRLGVGLTAKVVAAQVRNATRFLDSLEEDRVASVYAVGASCFKKWLDGLLSHVNEEGGKYAPSTIDSLVGAVRAFYGFLLDKGMVLADPTRGYRVQARGQKLPRSVLERREVARLLSSPDLTKPIEYRDRAILEVLYSTGMRRSEVTRLDVEDIDFVRGLARVEVAKNRMGRLVAIGRVALSYLAAYLEEVRPPFLKGGQKTGALFLSRSGGRLSAEQLGNRVKLYVLRSGIREEHSTHSLRHTCATHMLDGGAGVRIVAEQLGHRSLESTVVYTRVTPRGLEKAMRRYHPRERRKSEEVTLAPAVPRSWWARRRGKGGDSAGQNSLDPRGREE